MVSMRIGPRYCFIVLCLVARVVEKDYFYLCGMLQFGQRDDLIMISGIGV
jgi:hypothetical protein